VHPTACNSGNNVSSLCFSTESTANFNVCTAPTPLTGTFGSYGIAQTPIDWSLLNGCDATAPGWSVPTLLMFAGADRLVHPRGSRSFAQTAPSAVVTSRCFDDFYHEIFNELPAQREQVFAELQRWLGARF
jgi:alpha-beta hydrolase superfamily lysophospholipase